MGSIKLSELPPITKEEAEMITSAAQQTIIYDEDSPRMTPEMLSEFRRISQEKRVGRKKAVLSIRVSQSTLEKAQALGEGYTSILSRILDLALNDPELIKKCL